MAKNKDSKIIVQYNEEELTKNFFSLREKAGSHRNGVLRENYEGSPRFVRLRRQLICRGIARISLPLRAR